MTIHYLHMGGQRTQNAGPDYAFFPQTLPALNDKSSLANHKGNNSFSNSRTLDFMAGAYLMNPTIPQSLSPESYGAPALNYYIKTNVIAAGDTIATHVLPKGSLLEYVHVNVIKAITPFTFSLRVRGQAASVGAPVVLAASIDGGVLGSQLIDVQAKNANKPLYLNQNDVLEMIITTLPASTVGPDGYNMGGIFGAALAITAVGLEFERGAP